MGAATQAAIAAWYIQQMAAIRQRVETAQNQAYGASDQSDDAADAYVATMVPLMAGAEAAAAQLTAAYLAFMAADLAGQALSSVSPPSVDLSKVTGAPLRNGVDPEVVYRRPFQQVWTDLSKAKRQAEQAVSAEVPDLGSVRPRAENPPAEDSRAQAVEAGRRRGQTIALTDLQLATTHTAQDVMASDSRIIGYRRVLTGAENCGMCVVASTALYHKRSLMPIHPGCDCGIAPVWSAGQDPGRFINSHTIGEDAMPAAVSKHGVPVFDAAQTVDLGNLLEDAHQAVAGRFGKSYRDAKRIDYRKVITVRQHGETGPTLTVARHRFTKRQLSASDLTVR